MSGGHLVVYCLYYVWVEGGGGRWPQGLVGGRGGVDGRDQPLTGAVGVLRLSDVRCTMA